MNSVVIKERQIIQTSDIISVLEIGEKFQNWECGGFFPKKMYINIKIILYEQELDQRKKNIKNKCEVPVKQNIMSCKQANIIADNMNICKTIL